MCWSPVGLGAKRVRTTGSKLLSRAKVTLLIRLGILAAHVCLGTEPAIKFVGAHNPVGAQRRMIGAATFTLACASYPVWSVPSISGVCCAITQEVYAACVEPVKRRTIQQEPLQDSSMAAPTAHVEV